LIFDPDNYGETFDIPRLALDIGHSILRIEIKELPF